MSRRITFALVGLFTTIFAPLSYLSTASAHVLVRPAQVLTASFQTFTVSVPNEKDIATTNIKLTIPDNLKYVTPTVKPGWQIATDRSGEGEAAKVRSITWTGGSIAQGLRDDFTFSAQVPDTATEIQWKAYQTYADGTVVSWDKAESTGDHDSEDGNSGPLSVTNVVTQTANASNAANADQTAASAKRSADRAMYVAVGAVIIALFAAYQAGRRR